MSVEVAPVAGKVDREQFLRLPWRLYRDDPAWVPNLLILQREVIDPKKNPFFDDAEAQLFLARRDGEPVPFQFTALMVSGDWRIATRLESILSTRCSGGPARVAV